MKVEEILKKLRENDDVKEVVSGDYLSFFKRIGDNKSVTKVMDFKPDYFVNYFDGSFDCVVFTDNVFSVFSHLSKLLIFKRLNCELDFKSIIFYSKESKLLESEDLGLITEKKKVDTLDAKNFILELINDFEKRLGKKVVLHIE